ncbi:MAG: hypothetical protein E6G64_15510, partial [Actinobacteria bacterium]
LAREYGVEPIPSPATDDETAALVRHAEIPRRLAPTLLERVRERGGEHLYREIELPLTAVLAAMEDAGVKIDTYRMGEITARLADRVEELEAKAYELAGEEFMIGSTQQVARILFEKLQLTPGRKGKTGYSTDTRVLRSIRHEHPLVEVIEEWREYSKLLNTYLGPLPSLISEEDGRLHTHFNQMVASTGRLSTSNPNLQAIPIRTELGKEIRSAFVAEPGSRLLSADYSQIELRILAHVSGERRSARQGGGVPHERRPQHRQDDQLRHRLRDLRLRSLGEPRDSPRAGAGVHRRLSGALSARPGFHRADDRTGEARRVRDLAPRPPSARAGDQSDEPPDALARRAAGRQLRDAGLERGHHQGGDDQHPSPAARRGTRRAPGAAGPRRAAARGAGGRGRASQGARPRGDGSRVSARSAARGRCRRRRRLERGKGLSAVAAVTGFARHGRKRA